ncbi:formyl transferase [Flammula alnicola]|nr:formyl transferase [Flammula alnicola]
MGRDEFSCLVLQELFQAKDVWSEIVIATQPDVHVGRRGSILSVSPLRKLGESLDIPVHTIPKVKREFRNWILPHPFSLPTEFGDLPPANHLLVTASFGRILTDKMLSAFQPSYRLNVHPSLLPAYRGAAPIQHTIMDGETETGVCVIKMLKRSEGIDAGSLWGCHKMSVPENATFPSLRDELAPAGGQLLVSVLRDMLNGKAIAQPQVIAANAPGAPFITSKDTEVDFSSMTAEEIYRRFRALNHQKPLFTYTPDGKPLHLCELNIVNSTNLEPESLSTDPGWATFTKTNGMLLVRCAGDSVLGVTKVKPWGKPDRFAGEFWNGLRDVKKGAAKQVFFGLPKKP